MSRAAADQAIAESRAADEIIACLGETNNAMGETAEAMMQIRALGGMVPFGVNFTSNVPRNYSVPGASYSTPNAQASPEERLRGELIIGKLRRLPFGQSQAVRQLGQETNEDSPTDREAG